MSDVSDEGAPAAPGPSPGEAPGDAPGDASGDAPPPGRRTPRALLLLALILIGAGVVAFLLTRGGGGPHPTTEPGPTSAPTGAFCKQYAAVVAVDDGRSVHEWAGAMAKVGTPRGLSEAGREGFELVLAASDQVDAGDSARDLEAIPADLDPADQAKVDAFTDYANTTCLDEVERAVQEQAANELPS